MFRMKLPNELLILNMGKILNFSGPWFKAMNCIISVISLSRKSSLNFLK